jgi:hypothetical protein
MTENDNEDHSHLLKLKNSHEHQVSDKLTQGEISTLKKGASEWGFECLFVSHSLEKTMLFAVMNRFIEAEDFLSFKCLEEKLNMQL